MKNLDDLIRAAQSGDLNAFAEMVRRFQDMAFGYAYTLLSDFHRAEDATQEAFVEAYHNLPKLKNRSAFSGWFRRIVQYRCHRLLRGRSVPAEPLGSASNLSASEPAPDRSAADREVREAVLAAINDLNGPQRETTLLFYINGYSHEEISEFLEVPVGTVKSRLHASRNQLNERLIAMAKDALEPLRPKDDFVKKILEDVPHVGFFRGGNRCPESFPFPSCLAACLKKMGKDLGFREIAVQSSTWQLNKTYLHLMGTSGEAFRLFWKPGWHLDNSDFLSITPDSIRFFSNAFEAAGFSHELIHKDHHGAEESLFCRKIVESIGQKGRPVLGFGVIGPPECAVITGFDLEGKVLLGWSFFQDQPEFNLGVEFESSGYFRKRHWFMDTQAVIIIGDEQKKLSMTEQYQKSFEWAVELIRKPVILLDETRRNGLAAFQAWADAVAKDDDFAEKEMDTLRKLHMVHTSAVGTVAEGRWYASLFLKEALQHLPHLAEPLEQAAASFEKEHTLMWKLWGLVGGIGFSDAYVKQFADPKIRKEMTPLILEARDLDAQGADQLEKALAIWEA